MKQVSRLLGWMVSVVVVSAMGSWAQGESPRLALEGERMSIRAMDRKEEHLERLGELASAFYQEVLLEGGAGRMCKSAALGERLLTGAAAEDQFGASVSSAGDVNGDGYGDVIVGARLNDAGGSNAGRAYIYYGGRIIDTIVDVILTGEAAGDYFGYSVSGAGDVNGDGYADVVVGAPGNEVAGMGAGRALCITGGCLWTLWWMWCSRGKRPGTSLGLRCPVRGM